MDIQIDCRLESIHFPRRSRILITQSEGKRNVISDAPGIFSVQFIVVLSKFSQFRGSLRKNTSSLRIAVEEIGVYLRHRSGKRHCGAREQSQVPRLREIVAVSECVRRIPTQSHAESVVHNEIWKGQRLVLPVIPDVAKGAAGLNGMPSVRPDHIVSDFVHWNLMAKGAAEVLNVGKRAHVEQRPLGPALRNTQSRKSIMQTIDERRPYLVGIGNGDSPAVV